MSDEQTTELTALTADEIKDAIFYKLISIAVQVAHDPRDVDDLGKLVSALTEVSNHD